MSHSFPSRRLSDLPLVSPEQDVSLVHRLNVSAAARFEHYPSVGDVVTPKLGLVYEPTPDFDLKASWGRSFRAPTLYQQFQPQSAYLVSRSEEHTSELQSLMRLSYAVFCLKK